MLYGADCFIYDMQLLCIDLGGEDYLGIKGSAPAEKTLFPHLVEAAVLINKKNMVNPRSLDLFISNCCTRVISDPINFQKMYSDYPEFQKAYKFALKHCGEKRRLLMQQVVMRKNIALN